MAEDKLSLLMLKTKRGEIVSDIEQMNAIKGLYSGDALASLKSLIAAKRSDLATLNYKIAIREETIWVDDRLPEISNTYNVALGNGLYDVDVYDVNNKCWDKRRCDGIEIVAWSKIMPYERRKCNALPILW